MHRYMLKRVGNFLLVVSVLTAAWTGLQYIDLPFTQKSELASELAQESTKNREQVLGREYQAPQIYIYSIGDQSFGYGGMISQASTDEPAVLISGHNISGTAEIAVYEANQDALLEYLIHDKDGKQTQKPDASRFQHVTTVTNQITTNSYEGIRFSLPLKETGIWLLKVKVGNITADSYVVRSSVGVVTKEGDNQLIFWGQNFKTKRSIQEGSVKVYNLQDGKRELQSVNFTSEGIAKTSLNIEADVALVSVGDDRAIVPINLRYLNQGYNYKSFQPKSNLTRYFIFTDRPLYQPGDKIYFKSVLRNDDDVRYSIPQGEALVKMYQGYYYGSDQNQPIFEKKYPISADGTVSGEYQLPINAKVDNYTPVVSIPTQTNGVDRYQSEWTSNTAYFDVQFFQKPEFSLDITSSAGIITSGDEATFQINGTYFSGQPLAGQKVKYVVHSSDYYEYHYLSDRQSQFSALSDRYRYGYWNSGNPINEGVVTLDNLGQAEIDLTSKLKQNNGESQVLSVEATLEDGSQTPAFARKNILVYAGDYGIYRQDSAYGSKVNTPLSLPLVIVPNADGKKISGITLTAQVLREYWEHHQVEGEKYPSYLLKEEELPEITVKTDTDGKATVVLNPTQAGSYKVTVTGEDERGNRISKAFYSYVTADDQPYFTTEGSSELTIKTDKQKYQPNDTVQLSVFSSTPDRDVLLTLERGRVDRYQVVRLNGKTGIVDIPLVASDVPNIYANVTSFSNFDIDRSTTGISVSPEGKRLVVNLATDGKTYGPGETVTVDVTTTDLQKNPMSANVALWTVDKAIFELADNQLGDIFDKYWQERTNTTASSHSLEGITALTAEMGGGCFGEGTPVMMAKGATKNIEDIKAGEYVLTRPENSTKLVEAKVLSTHKAEVEGSLILNGSLFVTANHIMRVNNEWTEAGSIQIGDRLINTRGEEVVIDSIEWQRGKLAVYNLEIDKYHTYFANGVWVHNQKGGSRSVFKDTAYWNPNLKTNASGKARISFKLPDNLTTWTLAAVGSTNDTKVGQTTAEIVVTKDVIVRPILPNLLRQDDELYLSALIQNFTEADHKFAVELKFDAGEVEQAKRESVTIKAKEIAQLYWKVLPKSQKENAKLTLSATDLENSKLGDTITKVLPVKALGFEDKQAQVGEGSKKFSLKLADDSNKEKSFVTLSLASNMIGTLPTAMKYLINYPYGCVEQTTSRFVPAVIAMTHQDMFSEALADKNIKDIIDRGVTRLKSLQGGDGGWAWWSQHSPDSYITAYVTEYLLAAKKAGVEVDQDVLGMAKAFLQRQSVYDQSGKETPDSLENLIAKNYGLTLFGETVNLVKAENLIGLQPDLVAYAVMTNYLNGDTNPKTNGLELLISMAQSQGDVLYWNSGSKVHFGSKDASTALALRAILLAQGDRDVAVKAVRYLTRKRQSEFWSNTYATAQVIQAMVDFSKSGEEMTPNYTYTVKLDGKQISQGKVTHPKQVIKDIKIPLADMKAEGSQIDIAKQGDGQLYSTLVMNEFRTDKRAAAVDRGLHIKREYVNDAGEQYSLSVGDVALVKLTVSGLTASENYGVINDELPSGLVPINQAFKNEQYGSGSNNYQFAHDGIQREITQNGMVLSMYSIDPGENVYTYKARVVSEGVFTAPPATVSLMYAPEIFARSDIQTLTVTKEREIIPSKVTAELTQKYIKDYVKEISAGILFVLIIAMLLVLKFRQKSQPIDEVPPEKT